MRPVALVSCFMTGVGLDEHVSVLGQAFLEEHGGQEVIGPVDVGARIGVFGDVLKKAQRSTWNHNASCNHSRDPALRPIN